MYNELFKITRLREPENAPDKSLPDFLEATEGDRVRILYSSPFRRLQKKAQVFSLEENPDVRSRLTHSLEVSNIGRKIALKVTKKLVESGDLSGEYLIPFVNVIENGCLLHDIGNPPFGHFGEAAVRDWFKGNWEECLKKSFGDSDPEAAYFKSNNFISDFTNYDGNPQGLRIAIHLQEAYPNHMDLGFNLTCTQLLASMKYLRSTDEKLESVGHFKKYGCFITEKEQINLARKKLDFKSDTRFPLSYIIEAADDISYCLSDIEDGVEKDIVDIDEFFDLLLSSSTSILKEIGVFNVLDSKKGRCGEERFFAFKTSLVKSLINNAAKLYCDNHKEFYEGKRLYFFEDTSPESKILDFLKTYSRNKLFVSPEAENKELAGYKIISGILDAFKPLLIMRCDDFKALIRAKQEPNAKRKGFDYEWRLLNKLPGKYLSAYKNKVSKITSGQGACAQEWHLRSHLVVDYISGMTDNYALKIYHLLQGVEF